MSSSKSRAISTFIFLLSKMGPAKTAARNKQEDAPTTGPGAQRVPKERQVSSLQLTWSREEGGPFSHALAKDLDTKGKEEVWGNRAHGQGQGRKCLQFWHLTVTCF